MFGVSSMSLFEGLELPRLPAATRYPVNGSAKADLIGLPVRVLHGGRLFRFVQSYDSILVFACLFHFQVLSAIHIYKVC